MYGGRSMERSSQHGGRSTDAETRSRSAAPPWENGNRRARWECAVRCQNAKNRCICALVDLKSLLLSDMPYSHSAPSIQHVRCRYSSRTARVFEVHADVTCRIARWRCIRIDGNRYQAGLPTASGRDASALNFVKAFSNTVGFRASHSHGA